MLASSATQRKATNDQCSPTRTRTLQRKRTRREENARRGTARTTCAYAEGRRRGEEKEKDMFEAHSGVPHSVYVLPFTCFANPKSVICAQKQTSTTCKQSCSEQRTTIYTRRY